MLLAGPMANATAAGITADYDGDMVGPFDSFDMAMGALLIEQDPGLGTFKGYYQAVLTGYALDAAWVDPGMLNKDYEVTVRAEFSGTYQAFGPITAFTIDDSGWAEMRYGDIDASITNDSGFDNGRIIAAGKITGGAGSIIPDSAGGLTGGSTLFINTDVVDGDVFSPVFDTATAAFTQQNPDFTVDAGTVMGHDIEGNLLLGADGNIAVNPVPVPAAAWLFMSALVGLGFTARRRSSL